MRTARWIGAALAATLCLPATAALAAFDTELVIAPTSAKELKIEKPAAARDYIDHTAIYIRFIPLKGNKAYPVFINTRNYLQCPDNEKKWYVNDVKQVAGDRRSGVRVLGFFFDKPPCEKPKQYLEAITAESGGA